MKIKRALLSVSDKSGIEVLAKGLADLKIEIISTGGTAALLKKQRIPVRDVASVTGFPEMLDGRVKTLHPLIHGGLLAARSRSTHLDECRQHNIELIDMVVVNLYPFEKAASEPGAALERVLEEIDIGGPSMLRSGAKNFDSVAVVTHPDQYEEILAELKSRRGGLARETLSRLAVAAFELSAAYDAAVSRYLRAQLLNEREGLPERITVALKKGKDLRYGENPHQRGAFYMEPKARSFDEWARLLGGKELSFNNIMDASCAWRLVKSFKGCAAAIVKHGTPCGVAVRQGAGAAYLAALKSDPESAFGGIVGFNQAVDRQVARKLVESFLEVIVAPSFSREALEVLRLKKNLRVLEPGPLLEKGRGTFNIRFVPGGALVQDFDEAGDKEGLKVVTKKKPAPDVIASLRFAWQVVKFAHSNAIVLAKGTETVGISSGGTSRVEGVRAACRRAGSRAQGAVIASDGFFPKPDNVEAAHEAGVTAIIQPGGSIKDADVISAADRLGVAMVFTGVRHFSH
ncbi:MAG: bifunctional phosphoribosylaminoimidazolecarboxamide formyltransferase/IMP cyclohydrolase [Candidatus Omnitrophica bacterium]|nr:bifunctional phosphoribosylaminoimidazolecarboxamide formyltransferase/IMP cyclohydrolase [Candidatus Omnitrophota bacterium]